MGKGSPCVVPPFVVVALEREILRGLREKVGPPRERIARSVRSDAGRLGLACGFFELGSSVVHAAKGEEVMPERANARRELAGVFQHPSGFAKTHYQSAGGGIAGHRPPSFVSPRGS
jgi:hypothetical protein